MVQSHLCCAPRALRLCCQPSGTYCQDLKQLLSKSDQPTFEPQAVVPSKSNLRQAKQLAQLHLSLWPSDGDEATCKSQGPCKCLRVRECLWLPSGSLVEWVSIELFTADSGCPRPLVICTSAGLSGSMCVYNILYVHIYIYICHSCSA